MGFPPTESDLFRSALSYIAHGWSVIPIRPSDKRPLVKWEEYQTRLPTKLEWAEWSKTPNLNIALVTGKVSDITVVDVDGEEGMESIKACGRPLPKTLLQKSPHGWHMFFRYCENLRNKAGLLSGVDVRGEGGYVLIAPSHLSDGSYTWRRQCTPQPFPEWLIPASEGGPQRPAHEKPRWVSFALTNGAEAGQRNAMATRLAGYLFGRGLPEDVVRATLEPYCLACKPDLSPTELNTTIRSVSRYRKFASAAGVMDPPTVQKTAAGERYLWDDLAVEVRTVSRNKTALLAELGVTLALPGLSETVRAPRVVNLLSQRDCDSFAESLRRVVPEVQWSSRIDVLCRLVLESYRRGDPAVLLKDCRRANGVQYALEPLLLSDSPTVWFASGGVGKSLLALAAASALAGHDVFAGMRAKRPMRVLYLDWEWEDWQHAERLRLLLGDDTDVADLLYRRCYGALPDEIEAIRQIVADEEIGYVVIDSLGAACGGDLNDADTAIRFNGLIRSLNVGSLWITHVTKNNEADVDRPFGSIYFHNMARLVWRVKRQTEVDSDEIAVGFYCTKSNATRLHKPVGLTVRFGERISITPADLLSHSTLAAGLPIRDRILRALTLEPTSEVGLAEELGTTRSTIHKKLEALQKAGTIEAENGHWKLAPTSEVLFVQSDAPAWMECIPFDSLSGD